MLELPPQCHKYVYDALNVIGQWFIGGLQIVMDGWMD